MGDGQGWVRWLRRLGDGPLGAVLRWLRRRHPDSGDLVLVAALVACAVVPWWQHSFTGFGQALRATAPVWRTSTLWTLAFCCAVGALELARVGRGDPGPRSPRPALVTVLGATAVVLLGWPWVLAGLAGADHWAWSRPEHRPDRPDLLVDVIGWSTDIVSVLPVGLVLLVAVLVVLPRVRSGRSQPGAPRSAALRVGAGLIGWAGLLAAVRFTVFGGLPARFTGATEQYTVAPVMLPMTGEPSEAMNLVLPVVRDGEWIGSFGGESSGPTPFALLGTLLVAAVAVLAVVRVWRARLPPVSALPTSPGTDGPEVAARDGIVAGAAAPDGTGPEVPAPDGTAPEEAAPAGTGPDGVGAAGPVPRGTTSDGSVPDVGAVGGTGIRYRLQAVVTAPVRWAGSGSDGVEAVLALALLGCVALPWVLHVFRRPWDRSPLVFAAALLRTSAPWVIAVLLAVVALELGRPGRGPAVAGGRRALAVSVVAACAAALAVGEAVHVLLGGLAGALGVTAWFTGTGGSAADAVPTVTWAVDLTARMVPVLVLLLVAGVVFLTGRRRRLPVARVLAAVLLTGGAVLAAVQLWVAGPLPPADPSSSAVYVLVVGDPQGGLPADLAERALAQRDRLVAQSTPWDLTVPTPGAILGVGLVLAACARALTGMWTGRGAPATGPADADGAPA